MNNRRDFFMLKSYPLIFFDTGLGGGLLLEALVINYIFMFKNPQYNSIKIVLILVVLAGVGYFVFGNISKRNTEAGLVFNAPASCSNTYHSVTSWGSFGTGNGQFDQPMGIFASLNGFIYVVDANNNRIQKFNQVGAYLSQFGTSGSGNGQFNRPTDISIGYDGNFYVTDSYNYRVQKLSSLGTYLSQFGSHGSGNGQFNSTFSCDMAITVFVEKSK